jgi:hypothetical protein
LIGSRAVARVLSTTGVAALAVLALAPAISSAASNPDTLTVAGRSSYTYTYNQSPEIQAVAQPNCQFLSNNAAVTLDISGPGVANPTLVSRKANCNSSQSLSPSASSVNTANPSWASGSAPAMNGTYTLTLSNDGRSRTATFTLQIPPAKPTGFAVTPDSSSSASFSWDANPEPDVTGYQITDEYGNVIAKPGSSCSGGTCSIGPVDLDSSVAGHTESFAIVAFRSCGSDSCSDLESPSADTADATFPAPPPPPPSPTPSRSSGGGSGSGSGGSGSGGSGSGGSGSGGSGSGSGSTSLGSVNGDGGGGNSGVGPLTTGSNGNGGSVNLGSTSGNSGNVSDQLPPAQSGTVQSLGAPPLTGVSGSLTPPGLGAAPTNIKYPKPLVASNHAAPSSIAHAIRTSLTLPPLWRGVAAAAVLLLIAIHLRAWVARSEAW